jgi:hypothetical protein
MSSVLDVLHMHEKIKRESFQCDIGVISKFLMS